MSLEALCDQELEVLDPSYSQGASFGTIRDYQPARRTVLAHVAPLDGTKLEQLKAMGSEVALKLWFAVDPRIAEGNRLRWVRKDVILEVVGTPVDRHGLGRIWAGTAKASRKDNVGRNLAELAG